MLVGVGLSGIEVDHQDHSASDRGRLRGLAADLELLITGSSDFHGDLGCNTTNPENFRRLLDVAARNASASGRTVPTVVGA
jgi:hypothetical protein